jgi:aminopeptidase
MRRGADRSLKWVSTLYPTEGYAMEAEMSLADFEDFVYRACHADDADPVAHWKQVEADQARIVDRLAGHDQVVLRGPNVDLCLSIKGRTFINAAGKVNMPDGEVFSGPVEDSVNGWVRFTYPAIYVGVLAEVVELTFSKGKVTKALAAKNQAFLLEMLASDPGASYVGEFAIGTNYEIDRFSHNILFDEKLGGSFHMALGAGYPDTGSKNKSLIHWDMICGMKEDAEILVDGEVIYKNGRFTF